MADLRAAGFGVPDLHAPFVLIDTASCGRESVRPALAAKGVRGAQGRELPRPGPDLDPGSRAGRLARLRRRPDEPAPLSADQPRDRPLVAAAVQVRAEAAA